MYRHFLILKLIYAFKGDRSSSAVFHLLHGKQTSQTIQDGYTYKVHSYFKALPFYLREDFEQDMKALHDQGLVIEEGVNQCRLTEKGSLALEAFEQQFQIPVGLNGWLVGSKSEVFWQRLSLIVQSLSHLVQGEKHFITITNDPGILRWGKQFFLASPYSREKLAQLLLADLHGLLASLSSIQKILIVHRLSGYRKEGVTFDQLSQHFQKQKEELYLHFRAALDRCVSALEESSNQYPLLSSFIDREKELRMTQSAQETLEWFNQGLSIDEIARRRRLKSSTIQDHLIEIARFKPEEVREKLLPAEVGECIQKVLEEQSTRRLSELKKKLPEEISYFHIRLALVFQEVNTGA
ncbi:helix-turn-helix domain-containing protein [Pullulanibacillus sp. KACC 23026]|uniref:helix-turn-helix domain-containing protein n=1 Tax=Pullulanibacillus sp. KACC 23026 TaxID=3028315 RepID=UPI0023B09AEF|nr:helix-turn-helix domain-containing protein [Pullulanibacillus sp. KACC 23026]WEG11408.1 helix-turn-helix domain-containing protein [Pullulanibacillus sp. KACC 23026]